MLSDDIITTFKTECDEYESDETTNKITYIGFFEHPNRIIFGTNLGFITIWNVTKGLAPKTKEEAVTSFKIPAKTMTKVIQIMELPSKVANSYKKHVYYILTIGNLYAINKFNHEVLQAFYKGESAKVSRPRLLQVGVLVIEN